MYSFQSPFAYAANNPIYYIDYMGMGPKKWWNRFKSWVTNTTSSGIPRTERKDTGGNGSDASSGSNSSTSGDYPSRSIFLPPFEVSASRTGPDYSWLGSAGPAGGNSRNGSLNDGAFKSSFGSVDNISNRLTQASFVAGGFGYYIGGKMSERARFRQMQTVGGNIKYPSLNSYRLGLLKGEFAYGIGRGLRFGGFGLGFATTLYTGYQFWQDPTLEGGIDLGFGFVSFFGLPGLTISAGYYLYTSPYIQQGIMDYHKQRAIDFGPGGSWERGSNLIYRGGLCFITGTEIQLSAEKTKPIEDIQIGDTILTFDFESHAVVETTVTKIHSLFHRNLVNISFSNGVVNVNTQDHPYYVEGKGWASFNPEQTYERYNVKASKLEIGDKCYYFQNGKIQLVEIESMKIEQGHVQTYNLTGLEFGYTYFANGILVHNESIRAEVPEKIK